MSSAVTSRLSKSRRRVALGPSRSTRLQFATPLSPSWTWSPATPAVTCTCASLRQRRSALRDLRMIDLASFPASSTGSSCAPGARTWVPCGPCSSVNPARTLSVHFAEAATMSNSSQISFVGSPGIVGDPTLQPCGKSWKNESVCSSEMNFAYLFRRRPPSSMWSLRMSSAGVRWRTPEAVFCHVTNYSSWGTTSRGFPFRALTSSLSYRQPWRLLQHQLPDLPSSLLGVSRLRRGLWMQSPYPHRGHLFAGKLSSHSLGPQ